MDNRSSSLEMMRKQDDLNASNGCDVDNRIAVQPNSKFSSTENYRYQDYQNLDRGDSGQSSAVVNNTSYQYPTEYLAAGGYRKVPSAESINQSRLHQEVYPSQTEYAQVGTKQIQFTPEMIRDQEILLTSMNQQRIPEPLIRRQFDRLLEEQSKQLRKLHEDTNGSDKRMHPDVIRYEKKVEPERINYTIAEKPSCINYVPEKTCGEPNCLCSAPITQSKYQSAESKQQQQYQQQRQEQYQHQQQQQLYQHHQQQLHLQQYQQRQQLPHHQQIQQQYQQHTSQHYQQPLQQPQEQHHPSEQHSEENIYADDVSERNRFRKVEPSSLLKIRLQKETLGSHGRNNGLQDSATALEIIKKCSYGQKKNKYGSSNVDRSEMAIRLNGAQDRSEMEHLPQQPVCERAPEKRQIMNGLENLRDPNMPPLVYKSWRIRKAQEEEQCLSYPPQRCQVPSYTQQAQVHHPVHGEHLANRPSAAMTMHSNNLLEVHSQQQPQQQQHPTIQYYTGSSDTTHTNSNINNLNYCPKYQEPKVIGGFTYFARKPQCIPNVPGRMCDDYSSVGQTKPATAF